MERRIAPRARLGKRSGSTSTWTDFRTLPSSSSCRKTGMVIRTILEPSNHEATFALELGIPGVPTGCGSGPNGFGRWASSKRSAFATPTCSTARRSAARALVFRRSLTHVLVASALVALGCDHGSALDQADLKSVIAADQATSQALKQADDAAHDGRNAEAADLLKRVASPPATRACRRPTAIAPRTRWGRTEKDAARFARVRPQARDGRLRARASRGDRRREARGAHQAGRIERRASALAEEIERGP